MSLSNLLRVAGAIGNGQDELGEAARQKLETLRGCPTATNGQSIGCKGTKRDFCLLDAWWSRLAITEIRPRDLKRTG